MDSNAKNSDVTESHPRGGYSARRRNYRPIIFVVAVLLIAGIVVFIFALNNKKPENSSTSSSNTNSTSTNTNGSSSASSVKTEEKSKGETPSEPSTKEPEVIDGKTPKNNEGEDANTANEITGVINYADSDGETLMIRVSIDQYLEEGTCLLELNAPATGDTFSLTDQITPSAATSSCSFDISTNLLIKGKYDMKITLDSAGKKGVLNGEVEI